MGWFNDVNGIVRATKTMCCSDHVGTRNYSMDQHVMNNTYIHTHYYTHFRLKPRFIGQLKMCYGLLECEYCLESRETLRES